MRKLKYVKFFEDYILIDQSETELTNEFFGFGKKKSKKSDTEKESYSVRDGEGNRVTSDCFGETPYTSLKDAKRSFRRCASYWSSKYRCSGGELRLVDDNSGKVIDSYSC